MGSHTRLPGTPHLVGRIFLSNLAKVSRENRAYVLVAADEDSDESQKMERLKHETQITEQMAAFRTARLETFVGLSKIERDFVVHQHISIWNNPGFEKYIRSSLFNRFRYARPAPYLCAIREQALPLEIAFIERYDR